MTPEPNQPNSLDDEIQQALDGVDLQNLGSAAEEEASAEKNDGLHRGVIAGISGDDVIVELGPRMQGVVSLGEFEEPPAVGSVHRFKLRGREDDLWLLSIREAREMAAWSELAPGSLVKARVSGQNQGGLELKIGSNDAFMPASQVSLDRDEDISTYLGQTLTALVLEVDRGRKRVVLSRRRLLEQERESAREESAGKLHPGMTLTGKVTRLEPFGAFVDLGGGIEGLVHVSNLSRKRVEHPSDVVQKGADVQVQILEIKDGGRRVGLGMKQLEPDPWDDVQYRFNVGSLVTGTVTRLMDFGAFVEIEPGLEGLLHVSQLGQERARRPHDHLKIGQEVSVRLAAIDAAARRLSLSLLDSRGAVLGSDESAASELIDEVLDQSSGTQALGTNLGSLFKKALGGSGKKGGGEGS